MLQQVLLKKHNPKIDETRGGGRRQRDCSLQIQSRVCQVSLIALAHSKQGIARGRGRIEANTRLEFRDGLSLGPAVPQGCPVVVVNLCRVRPKRDGTAQMGQRRSSITLLAQNVSEKVVSIAVAFISGQRLGELLLRGVQITLG